MIYQRRRRLATLLVALAPTLLAPMLAWGDDRGPMPPPGSTHNDTIKPQQSAAATASSTTAPSPSDQQVIAEVEGSDVRAYTRQDGTKITEYARQGRVYMIKVKPPGDLPAYYLYDEHGNGQFSRRLPGGYQHLAPPQWIIKEF